MKFMPFSKQMSVENRCCGGVDELGPSEGEISRWVNETWDGTGGVGLLELAIDANIGEDPGERKFSSGHFMRKIADGCDTLQAWSQPPLPSSFIACLTLDFQTLASNPNLL